MADTTKKRSAVIRTIEKCVIDESGCLIFNGSRNEKGYGRIIRDGRPAKTHRVMYEAMAGMIPDGLELDHLCRNRACCNPAHLEPVTHEENLRRSPLRGENKTHCLRGHPYDEENTRAGIDRNGNKYRQCRACAREKERRRRRRAEA